jgi:hypothetical protein
MPALLKAGGKVHELPWEIMMHEEDAHGSLDKPLG